MVDVNKIITFVDSFDGDTVCKECFFEHIENNDELYNEFCIRLKKAMECLKKDLKFFFESDPAANNLEEIKIAYPGYKAIRYHRVAHIFYELGLKVVARVISEHAHFLTGIDIHPGATIGCPFFIDHGTGIVIGETTVIGNYVKIYQGVTLGALSLEKGQALKGVKRHPTIGNNVIIYSGASILGGDVTIGDRTVIGSSVFILESIPSDSKVYLPKPELTIVKNK